MPAGLPRTSAGKRSRQAPRPAPSTHAEKPAYCWKCSTSWKERQVENCLNLYVTARVMCLSESSGWLERTTAHTSCPERSRRARGVNYKCLREGPEPRSSAWKRLPKGTTENAGPPVKRNVRTCGRVRSVTWQPIEVRLYCASESDRVTVRHHSGRTVASRAACECGVSL